MAELDLETDWGGELTALFMLAAPGERERFLRATSLDAVRYRGAVYGVAPNVSPRLRARRLKIAERSRRVTSGFSIYVAKENLKFSAAHFIAYPGFREPLHGHNYQVGVRVEGRLSSTGYVLDFGLIKRLTKEIVDRLDERTLVPAESDCLQSNIWTMGNSGFVTEPTNSGCPQAMPVFCRSDTARRRSWRASSGRNCVTP